MDTETTAWTCEFYKYLLENKQFGAPVFSCPYFGKLHTEFSKSVDTETFNQRVNANDSSMASVYTVQCTPVRKLQTKKIFGAFF